MRIYLAEDALAMRRPQVRFTIRSLMIAVAVVAGLLALQLPPIGEVAVIGLFYLPIIGVLWWMIRDFRRGRP